MSTFTDLGIENTYIKSLKELGIEIPTDIQVKTIPILLDHKTDFIGLAQTGTGKTAAYGLPILHQIDPANDEVQALILSPTRELAQQIKKQLFKFTKYEEKRIFSEAVYGGEKIDKQIKNLKRTTHVIVATPGRLVDLIERGDVNLKHVTTLVLDEADEMLSMGFKQELNRILRYTNKSKNIWLFSATMPEEVQQIIKKYLSPKSQRIEVDRNVLVNANITHQFIQTSIKGKLDIIVNFLERHDGERGIIFCRTKAGTQNLSQLLKEEGFSVDALEGDMQQKDRDKVMRAFKNKSLQVLISTDVSARGIDVKDLSYVIHHQLPEQIEYYTHRSGRTARAGKRGFSIALILPNEMNKISNLESILGIKFREVHF